MMFVRAYMRESREMVFDACDRAFAFFNEACTRGIYDSGHALAQVERLTGNKPTLRQSKRFSDRGTSLAAPPASGPASHAESPLVRQSLRRQRQGAPRPPRRR